MCFEMIIRKSDKVARCGTLLARYSASSSLVLSLPLTVAHPSICTLVIKLTLVRLHFYFVMIYWIKVYNAEYVQGV